MSYDVTRREPKIGCMAGVTIAKWNMFSKIGWSGEMASEVFYMA